MCTTVAQMSQRVGKMHCLMQEAGFEQQGTNIDIGIVNRFAVVMVEVKNTDNIVDPVFVNRNARVGRFLDGLNNGFAVVVNVNGRQVDSGSHYLLDGRFMEFKCGLKQVALTLVDDSFFLDCVDY